MKEYLEFGRRKKMDRRKGKLVTDIEVIETDGMYSCRTEYTSSSWSQKLYNENKLQIIPHSLLLRRLAMPLLSPGESDQTLTQWTVHTKGIGSFTTDCLIHTSPQPHTVHTKGIGLFSTIAWFIKMHSQIVHQH